MFDEETCDVTGCSTARKKHQFFFEMVSLILFFLSLILIWWLNNVNLTDCLFSTLKRPRRSNGQHSTLGDLSSGLYIWRFKLVVWCTIHPQMHFKRHLHPLILLSFDVSRMRYLPRYCLMMFHGLVSFCFVWYYFRHWCNMKYKGVVFLHHRDIGVSRTDT